MGHRVLGASGLEQVMQPLDLVGFVGAAELFITSAALEVDVHIGAALLLFGMDHGERH
jgi:hypothetical protein